MKGKKLTCQFITFLSYILSYVLVKLSSQYVYSRARFFLPTEMPGSSSDDETTDEEEEEEFTLSQNTKTILVQFNDNLLGVTTMTAFHKKKFLADRLFILRSDSSS